MIKYSENHIDIFKDDAYDSQNIRLISYSSDEFLKMEVEIILGGSGVSDRRDEAYFHLSREEVSELIQVLDYWYMVGSLPSEEIKG